jgi:hypothetical protein
MPRRRSNSLVSEAGDHVTDYRYADKGKHIAPAGLAAQGKVAEVPKTCYAYDPHLSPVLRFDETRGADGFCDGTKGHDFTIPHEYMGVSYHYEPDFLVRLAKDLTVVLEIKGMFTDQDNAKHEAAKRWVTAVNNWGQLGRWAFHVNKDPQMLGVELRHLFARHASSGMRSG